MLVAIYESLLIKKASSVQHKKVAFHSRYNEPIEEDNRPHGKTRNWGDADISVQALICNLLFSYFACAGFSEKQIAFILLLVRVESGFNPDASATSTSASGLGQFIDKTRIALANRFLPKGHLLSPWSIETQLPLLKEQVRDAFAYARQRAAIDTDAFFIHAYDFHHDGPIGQYGGEEIAKEKIIPLLPQALGCIRAIA